MTINPKQTELAAENENFPVGRFMDFSKYISLLQYKSIFFSNTEDFEDLHEGSLPVYNSVINNKYPVQAELRKKLKNCVYVNSWYKGSDETMDRWNNLTSHAVCIRSTYNKLKQAFKKSPPCQPYEIRLGPVQYIDYKKHMLPTLEVENILSTFFYKRKEFHPEKEIRAMFLHIPASNINQNSSYRYIKQCIEQSSKGFFIRVDLTKLIDNVIVSPKAEKWFYELVKDVTIKYCYQFSVSQSCLNDEAVY